MRYLPPGSMRKQRMIGRLEGTIVTLAIVSLLGFGFIAATPDEMYRPAPATHHPTPEGRLAQFQHVQMPPCGPGKDCSELDDGAAALPHRLDQLPIPNTQHNTNQVPEPGTLALICAGIALMWRKSK